MTKTLTEQWRDGTLPLNHYYVKTKSGRYGINHTVLSFDRDKPRTRIEYSDRTEEVIAPVPSYEQFIGLMDDSKELDKAYDKINLLEKKLEIAIKALKRIDSPNIIFDDYRNRGIDLWEIAHNALKEMEGVK